ncbi:MAG TPA: MtrB/PioB family outer membrane beta-barrel protein [Thermoanaerobaculia bacterium]|nr:MtrB/PioB family outer membrane beta-barrel protein [Thermoanaerobaculia bacterium]
MNRCVLAFVILAFSTSAFAQQAAPPAPQPEPAQEAAETPAPEEPGEPEAEEPAEPPAAPAIPGWPESQIFAGFKPGPAQFRIDFGAQRLTIDTESSKFDEYRDVPDGALLSFFGLSSVADQGRYVITGEDVGQRDVRYTIEAERGDFGINVVYDQIPHRFGNDARTLLQQTSRGRFEISDTLQRSFQTSIEQQRAISPAGVNFTFLRNLVSPSLDAANTIDIGLERKRGLLELSYGPGELWDWGGSEVPGAGPSLGSAYGVKVSYFQENRVGDRQAGTSFGFGNVVETPEPIDYVTRDVGISAELPLRTAVVRAGVSYNDFTNKIPGLLFDNPFRVTDATDANAYQSPGSSSILGSSRGQVALPPSNRAITGTVGLLMKLPASSRLNADVALSQWSQNETLLPYTVNTAITSPLNASDPAALPVSSFDGKITTLTGGLSFASRPFPKLGINARYRVYDMDNKSERVELPGYVRFDAVWEDIPRISVPYEYGTQRGDLAVTYDFGPVTLEGGYRHDVTNRTFRETEETTENALRLAADFRPRPWVAVRTSYERGSRDFDHYDAERAEHASFLDPGPAVNLPLLRRYDQAAKDLDRISALVQLTPFDGNLGVTLHLLQSTDDYDDESDFGLLESVSRSWTVEADYAPADRWSVYAFYSNESYDTFQRGRQSGATPSTNPLDDWTAKIQDDVGSLGVGGSYAISERTDLKFFSRYQRVDGNNDLDSPPGGTPDVAFDIASFDDTTLWTSSAELEYRLTDVWHLSVGGWIEDYQARDAQTTGIGNYMPGGFFLAPNDADYRGNVLYVRASYRR